MLLHCLYRSRHGCLYSWGGTRVACIKRRSSSRSENVSPARTRFFRHPAESLPLTFTDMKNQPQNDTSCPPLSPAGRGARASSGEGTGAQPGSAERCPTSENFPERVLLVERDSVEPRHLS